LLECAERKFELICKFFEMKVEKLEKERKSWEIEIEKLENLCWKSWKHQTEKLNAIRAFSIGF
jgi:hypothetical protein